MNTTQTPATPIDLASEKLLNGLVIEASAGTGNLFGSSTRGT